MRYNKDMVHDHACLVSGRKRNEGKDPDPVRIGIFNFLCEELQDSLIAVCKKGSV